MDPELRTEELSLAAGGRLIEAYLAEPPEAGTGRALPAVIVIHEIWGLVDHIRDVARRFAHEGYVALAPDLYTGPVREVLTPEGIRRAMAALSEAPADLRRDPERMREWAAGRPAEERPLIEALGRVMSSAQRDAFARELVDVRLWLAGRPAVAQDGRGARVGAVGFCMGGGLVARLATLDPGLRAGVIFYGHNPPLSDVPRIEARLYGIYGGLDRGITDEVPAFAEAMRKAGKPFDYTVYPGAKHAFFNDTGPNYDPGAALDAWRRTLEFLAQAL
ncbi:MAG: dienelactone hydrolase family protein [Clostridia bacterium]|nr:dienelactone hydrolase family protein [Clostridia bacterium]